ncbi:MAG: hypothetical protein EOM52_02820 [Clostridia bacterium]|nr:hypothetical protein [Clostridia bacterium]
MTIFKAAHPFQFSVLLSVFPKVGGPSFQNRSGLAPNIAQSFGKGKRFFFAALRAKYPPHAQPWGIAGVKTFFEHAHLFGGKS